MVSREQVSWWRQHVLMELHDSLRAELPLQRSATDSAGRTWLFLPGFGQVGDAGMRTHEHVAGMQRPLQEELLGLGQVDATQGRLG